MPDAEILIFRSWPSRVYDCFGQQPDGTYSQLAWLPTVGPTSWLLWGMVARQLSSVPDDISWDRDELARALGVNARSQHGWTIARTLKRLCSYRLLERERSVFLVRVTAPPVGHGSLDRLPADVQLLHSNLFGLRYDR
jgi:hypothetical protein